MLKCVRSKASDQNVDKTNNVQNFDLMHFGLTHFLNKFWTNVLSLKHYFGLMQFGLKNFGLQLIWPAAFCTKHPDPSKCLSYWRVWLQKSDILICINSETICYQKYSDVCFSFQSNYKFFHLMFTYQTSDKRRVLDRPHPQTYGRNPVWKMSHKITF